MKQKVPNAITPKSNSGGAPRAAANKGKSASRAKPDASESARGILDIEKLDAFRQRLESEELPGDDDARATLF